MARCKIALLVAQADEEYQSDFIRGAMEKAFSRDADVCVFSSYIKYQNSKAREIGESNIFNLVNYRLFDGVIVLSDMIQTPGVEKSIQEKLHASFSGPVVCVDAESDYFHTFWTDGYKAVYDTISRLIEMHDMKDIAYLTGRKGHVHSERRLEAYRDAMKAHGLPVREDRMFYGDFWYFCGNRCAETLLKNREDFPDAVVAANDPMAIGVAQTMHNAGLRIPEDISIVGYGSSAEGRNSPVPISSPYIPGSDYGSFAVEAIFRMLDGEEPGQPEPETRFFVGKSCGCGEVTDDPALHCRETWSTENSEGGYQSLHDFMMEDMLLADTIEDFLGTIYDYVYLLPGVKRLGIYLDEQWLFPDMVIRNMFLAQGYPERVVHALSYDLTDPKKCFVEMNRVMDTDSLIEENELDHPVGHIFLPLFFEDKSFGYAVLDHDGVARSIDTVTRHWMNSVCRGLEGFRRTMAMQEYDKLLEPQQEAKFPTPLEDKNPEGIPDEKLTPEEREEQKEVRKILDQNLLTYHFQPIVKASDGEIYSYEALMRSDSGHPIPPLRIIRYANGLGRLSDIEKATFLNVLRIVEEKKEKFAGKKVFINSIPGVKLKQKDDEAVENMLRKHSDQVVVELTEQAELEDDELESLKVKLAEMGAGVAVDDYGTGYSNVSNLLRYMPNCVKIDRSLLVEIQSSSQKQHFVRNIIDFCHDNKILALAEGVETREELQTVIHLGADLIQGYYVARPTAEPILSVDSAIKMEICRFYRECLDGINDQVYVAGKTPRVTMNNLIKEDKTTIIIGEGEMTYRDITIAGHPNVASKIHIEVMEGYEGVVTMENVTLSNQKLRPCIRMAENANLTLRLIGENRLMGGGILVPDSSSLTIEGEGNLKININGTSVYGIGNEFGKPHGKLEFYQDGEVAVEASGNYMVGIGSDLGGIIKIHKGKYTISVSGGEGVGIGSVRGSESLLIHDCDLSMDNAFREGVCIGSMRGAVQLEAYNSLLKITCSGTKNSILGTISDRNVKLNLHDMSMHFNIRSDNSTAFGSLEGETEVSIEGSAIRYRGAGTDGYLFGGVTPDTRVHLQNADLKARLVMIKGLVTNAPREQFEIIRGIMDVESDGEVIEF